MENLSPKQKEKALEKVAELLNYLNDEEIIFEFDNSLIDSLIRCYENLKVEIREETPNEKSRRLESYAKWYSDSFMGGKSINQKKFSL